MIKLEFKFAVRNASYATDASPFRSIAYIGINKLDVTKNAAKADSRCHPDKDSRSDLV